MCPECALAAQGYSEDSIYWHPGEARLHRGDLFGVTTLKGKRIRKSATGKMRAEARDKLKELHLRA
jgi:hypothetical protein